jgi:hypothetical protein
MAKSMSPQIGIEACNNAMATFGHPCRSSERTVEQRTGDAYGFDPPTALLVFKRWWCVISQERNAGLCAEGSLDAEGWRQPLPHDDRILYVRLRAVQLP